MAERVSKEEFIKRYIERMAKQHEAFFKAAAEASYEEYEVDIDHMTPEEWAESETESWD